MDIFIENLFACVVNRTGSIEFAREETLLLLLDMVTSDIKRAVDWNIPHGVSCNYMSSFSCRTIRTKLRVYYIPCHQYTNRIHNSYRYLTEMRFLLDAILVPDVAKMIILQMMHE
jgi:hypothetical protein